MRTRQPETEQALRFSIYSIYRLVFRYTRWKRMSLFGRLFAHSLMSGGRILDIGGAPDNWRYIDSRCRITLVNLEFPAERDPRFGYVVADARQLPFRDGTFDVAYSNSVIEHVGETADQRAFAAEASRAGRQYFIQTPDYYFPIEPHLIAPLIHYLPAKWQPKAARIGSVRGLLEGFSREAAERFCSGIRLLKYCEFQSLFPDGELIRERFLGLSKSLIAVRVEAKRHGEDEA